MWTIARLAPLQSLERAANQGFAALHQNLNRNIGGHAVLFDQAATKLEFDVGSRGKTDLDFLEADFAQ